MKVFYDEMIRRDEIIAVNALSINLSCDEIVTVSKSGTSELTVYCDYEPIIRISATGISLDIPRLDYHDFQVSYENERLHISTGHVPFLTIRF